MTRVLLAALLLVPVLAFAHGEAGWIQHNPNYLTATGVHCCGEQDCRRMTPEEVAEVEITSEGYVVDGKAFPFDERGLYWSIDAGWWWCRYTGLPVRCLFAPQGV